MDKEFKTFDGYHADILIYAAPNIHHIEFQSTNDPNIADRMLNYLRLIRQDYARVNGKPVDQTLQQLLYVGTDPIEMVNRLDTAGLTYHFEMNDIRRFEHDWYDRLVANESRPIDWVLGLLIKQTSLDEEWLETAERLQGSTGKYDWTKIPAPGLLLVSSSLRRISVATRKAILDMLNIDVTHDPVLRQIYDSGARRDRFDNIAIGLGARKTELDEIQSQQVLAMNDEDLDRLLGLLLRLQEPDLILELINNQPRPNSPPMI
ncbi:MULTISPECIES: hypothetical protein [Rhizobium]|uniref:hypothetical protein n=1 Tax=Rhizobium TaxID=379 RepID=UPI0013BC7777|nr:MULTISPECIES: hypothetical protein [Rhizobium]MBY3321327.1 hypothetical protein [Rhizobium laguerreae]MBY3362921.1 hypothetical protein [Rhizobium laguerreae]MCA2435860.1 hypothetical protein [Rhizobium leguminosarum]NEH73389.1 hypothetical protein [Rhizobium leguminosarum]